MGIDELLILANTQTDIPNQFEQIINYSKAIAGAIGALIGIGLVWKKLLLDNISYHKERFQSIKDALIGEHYLLIQEKIYSAYKIHVTKNLWLKLIQGENPLQNLKLYRSGKGYLKFVDNHLSLIEGKISLKTWYKIFSTVYFCLSFIGLGILVLVFNYKFSNQQIVSLLSVSVVFIVGALLSLTQSRASQSAIELCENLNDNSTKRNPQNFYQSMGVAQNQELLTTFSQSID